MIYKCTNCNKTFPQKSNYNAHINRKYHCTNRIITPKITSTEPQSELNISHDIQHILFNASLPLIMGFDLTNYIKNDDVNIQNKYEKKVRKGLVNEMVKMKQEMMEQSKKELEESNNQLREQYGENLRKEIAYERVKLKREIMEQCKKELMEQCEEKARKDLTDERVKMKQEVMKQCKEELIKFNNQLKV